MQLNKIHIWGMSNSGRLRDENQDCFMVNGSVSRDEFETEISEDEENFCKNGLMCAVADGLGGQKGGAIASESALRHIANSMGKLTCINDIDSLHKCLNRLILDSHKNLLKMAAENTAVSDMATTIVGIYFRKDCGFVYHAGDSRLYCLRKQKLIRLTEDHSLENYMRALAEDYEPCHKSGIITNCLGGGNDGRCTPEINKLTFNVGDILLLCSDGLSDMINDINIKNILLSGEPLSSMGKKLIDTANNSGGNDNISALLIERSEI